MMASKHLKIRFQGKGGGRTKNVLTFAEEEWFSAFLNRADISQQNGEKQYTQKCYLQWTIRELLGIINRKIPVEECSTFPHSFDKDLTFRQLYDFLKKRKQYKFCNQTPHESCTCKICKNIRLFTSSINRKMKDSKIPNNVKELVEEYSCDVSNAYCMKGTCLNCPSVSVSLDDGASSSRSSSSSESEGDSDSDNDDSELKYFQWLSIDGKANKAFVSTLFDQVEAILKAKIKELKLNIFVRNEQYKAYNNLKNEMPPNAILLHVDYAESYENKLQDEFQLA